MRNMLKHQITTSALTLPVCPCLLHFFYTLTLKFNINMAFLKSLLLLAGDIESNHGPDYRIQKSVLATFHQGHPKFGDTSGIQCSCIALYAICFSIIKKVSVWKTWDLDYILENGDATFKCLNIPRPLFMNELPHNIVVENEIVNIEMLGTYYGILSQNNYFDDHKLLSLQRLAMDLLLVVTYLELKLKIGLKAVHKISHDRRIQFYNHMVNK